MHTNLPVTYEGLMFYDGDSATRTSGVGGLVGLSYQDSTITTCYSTGNVEGRIESSYIGARTNELARAPN